VSRKEIVFPTNIGALIMAAIKSIRKISNRGQDHEKTNSKSKEPAQFRNRSIFFEALKEMGKLFLLVSRRFGNGAFMLSFRFFA
jgi:hypothetical protein